MLGETYLEGGATDRVVIREELKDTKAGTLRVKKLQAIIEKLSKVRANG